MERRLRLSRSDGLVEEKRRLVLRRREVFKILID